MKLDRRARILLKLQKSLFLLLFLSLMAMLAWLSQQYRWQFDLTANQRHSLSDSSIELLQLLDEPVRLHAYTTDEVTMQAVEEIIQRYRRVKNDFELVFYNPDIDIEQAKSDGIVMNRPFAFVVYYQGRAEQLDSLSEQAISNALLRLLRRQDQRVVFLSGHGERELDAGDNRAYGKLKQQLADTGFKLQSLNLLQDALPDDTRLLVIAAPQHDYLPGEIERIRDYLAGGGNLLWLRDPGEAQLLDELAADFGLHFQPGLVVDNNPELRRTLKIQHPAIIPVTEYFPHAITRNIRYNSLFPLARGISPLDNAAADGWLAHALFSSFGKSWTEAGGLSEEMSFHSAEGDIAGPITLGVALQRPRPQADDGARTQRAVVIGDSDFLADAYIGAGANLSLGLNIFNWLIGDDAVVDIEPRITPDTRLQLDDNELMLIAVVFLIALPALLLIAGLRIAWLRKRR